MLLTLLALFARLARFARIFEYFERMTLDNYYSFRLYQFEFRSTKTLLATLVKVKKIGNLLLVFSTTMEENVALASRKKLRDNNLFLLLLRLLSTFLKENVPNGK